MWEFASGLPVETRLRGGQLKAILREIVRRRIGTEVGSRPKQGFTVPLSRWLMDEQRSQWDVLRDSRRLRELGWIDKTAVDSMLDRALQQQEAPPSLWHLLVLAHWLERRQV